MNDPINTNNSQHHNELKSSSNSNPAHNNQMIESTTRGSNDSSTKIIKNTHKPKSKSKQGKEYECTYYNINNYFNKKGYLSIGSKAISFHIRTSSSFFWIYPSPNHDSQIQNNSSVVVYIPMEEISYLEKLNHDGIRCKTIHGDEYIFRYFRMHTRNIVLRTICERMQHHLSKSLRHCVAEEEQTITTTTTEQQQLVSPRALAVPEKQLRRSLSEPFKEQSCDGLMRMENEEERKRAGLALAALADFSELSLCMRESSPVVEHIEGEVIEEKKEHTTVIGSIVTVSPNVVLIDAAVGNTASPVTASREEVDVAWNVMKSSRESDFSNHVVNDLEVSSHDLESFYETFLADHAEYSVGKYLSSKGDTAVQVSPWECSPKSIESGANDDTTNCSTVSTRVITYLHPVTIPMAPPSAKATKQQRIHFFGSKGICLETNTIVNDVPLTDCFHVKDILFVEARDNFVFIHASFEICFTQRTIWKGVIQFNTSAAFQKYLGGYASFVTQCMKKEGVGARFPCFEVDTHTSPTSSDTSSTTDTNTTQDHTHSLRKQSSTSFYTLSDRTILIVVSILSLLLVVQQSIVLQKMYDMQMTQDLNSMEMKTNLLVLEHKFTALLQLNRMQSFDDENDSERH